MGGVATSFETLKLTAFKWKLFYLGIPLTRCNRKTLIANVIWKIKTICFSPLLSILLLLYSQAMYIGQTHLLDPTRKVFCMSRMLWKRINGWLPKVMHRPIVVLNYAPTIVPITVHVLATVTVPSIYGNHHFVKLPLRWFRSFRRIPILTQEWEQLVYFHWIAPRWLPNAIPWLRTYHACFFLSLIHAWRHQW